MRKWFSGKVTKQEFDREAREIVTENYGFIKSILKFSIFLTKKTIFIYI